MRIMRALTAAVAVAPVRAPGHRTVGVHGCVLAARPVALRQAVCVFENRHEGNVVVGLREQHPRVGQDEVALFLVLWPVFLATGLGAVGHPAFGHVVFVRAHACQTNDELRRDDAALSADAVVVVRGLCDILRWNVGGLASGLPVEFYGMHRRVVRANMKVEHRAVQPVHISVVVHARYDAALADHGLYVISHGNRKWSQLYGGAYIGRLLYQ